MCIVNFEDFARFAQYWMQSGSDIPADLSKDGIVDDIDKVMFCEEWLYECPRDWPLK